MRRLILPVAALIVTLLLFLIGAELLAMAYLYATEGKLTSARDRFASTTNAFVEGLVGSSGRCGYLDTLFPHPYLGFVHHGNSPCGIADINNVGLFGPDYPSSRPSDRFVILLTGGSVAHKFASGFRGGPPYLERYLNERFVSPNGKPFLILNGGDGAWKQPQQAILFLLFADAVHAVVTLDGFNEHYMLQSNRRFEFPANNFLTANPFAVDSPEDVLARWVIGRARARAAANPILSRSHAVYSLISMAEGYVKSRMEIRPDPKTTIDSIFDTPRTWTNEERKAWQLVQYRKYIRAIDAVAQQSGVLAAHFIQPAPAIGKALTPDEVRVVGDLSYRSNYREMANSLMSLNEGGTTIVSLLDLLKNQRETLYADAIHFALRPDGSSRGDELMADQMSSDLGVAWRLKKAHPGAAQKPGLEEGDGSTGS